MSFQALASITALAASSLVACGPSVATLVRQHRTAEAICATSRKSEREQALSFPLLLREQAPAWRAHAIQRGELGLPPELEAQLFDHYNVVVIEQRTASPSSGSHGRSGIDSTSAWSLNYPSDFAKITGESVPDTVEWTREVDGLAILTLGLSYALAPSHRGETRQATSRDRRRAAPRSARIFDAIVARYGAEASLAIVPVGDKPHESYIWSTFSLLHKQETPCSFRVDIELRSAPFTVAPGAPWPTSDEFTSYPTNEWIDAMLVR